MISLQFLLSQKTEKPEKVKIWLYSLKQEIVIKLCPLTQATVNLSTSQVDRHNKPSEYSRHSICRIVDQLQVGQSLFVVGSVESSLDELGLLRQWPQLQKSKILLVFRWKSRWSTHWQPASSGTIFHLWTVLKFSASLQVWGSHPWQHARLTYTTNGQQQISLGQI